VNKVEGPVDEYQLTPDTNVVRTSYLDEVSVPPRRLVDVFGPPAGGDGYKVTGMYVFTGPKGDVFTLYDWKATSQFDDGLEPGEEAALPTPDEFWGNWHPEPLHIGGRSARRVAAFKQWLLAKLAEPGAAADRAGGKRFRG
jgi:hypothetical protein